MATPDMGQDAACAIETVDADGCITSSHCSVKRYFAQQFSSRARLLRQASARFQTTARTCTFQANFPSKQPAQTGSLLTGYAVCDQAALHPAPSWPESDAVDMPPLPFSNRWPSVSALSRHEAQAIHQAPPRQPTPPTLGATAKVDRASQSPGTWRHPQPIPDQLCGSPPRCPENAASRASLVGHTPMTLQANQSA